MITTGVCVNHNTFFHIFLNHPCALFGNRATSLQGGGFPTMGLKPRPPPNVSAQEYKQGPDHWLNQTFPGLGRVTGFNEGVYTIYTGGADKDLYHYELMAEISTARTTQF